MVFKLKLCLIILGFLSGLPVYANNFGSDEQNFNPSTSRNDFLVTESGNTLDEGQASNNFYIDFSSGGNLFQQRFPPTTVIEEPGGGKMFFNLGFGYGLSKNWDLGLGLAALIVNSAEDDETHLSTVSIMGLSSVRLNAKYRFYTKGYTRLAVLMNVDHMAHNDNAYTGTGGGPHFSGMFVAQALLYERLIGSFNFGYKHRMAGDTQLGTSVTPMNQQIIYSGGLAYIIPSIRTKLIFEGYGSTTTEAIIRPTERRASNFEGLVAMRFFIQKDLHFTFGGTSGFYRGLATPDARVFLGLTWLSQDNKENEYPYIYETSREQEHIVVVEESLGETMIYFAKGSSSHDAASDSEMKKAYQFVNQWKGSIGRMVIEGHTDHTGSEQANRILSETRAQTIKNHIVQKTGLDPHKISTKGFGESQPIADNNTRAGRAKNRRVVIKVYE